MTGRLLVLDSYQGHLVHSLTGLQDPATTLLQSQQRLLHGDASVGIGSDGCDRYQVSGIIFSGITFK
jgi:hypothetical protein